MFKSARIKLTVWYLLIIMIISVLFSAVVYRGFLLELRRGLRDQSFRFPIQQRDLESIPPFRQIPIDIENEIYDEAKDRILLSLIEVNLGILITAGFAGYFLAGRTLRPIEQMVDEQKRFVADASHELRTPLTSLKTEIEVFLRDKKPDIKEAESLLKSNLEEVDKMQKLSNYLLILNNYQNNQTKLPKDYVNLREIASNVVGNLARVASKKGIIIKKDLSDAKMLGNEDSLGELVKILLDNAVKYSPKGAKVILKTKKLGKSMILEVQDFGIGIRASEIPHIFDRFYRADSSRSKEKVDGYGLGLSIAKTIVEMHNGKIQVESILSKGSTFKVEFPS